MTYFIGQLQASDDRHFHIQQINIKILSLLNIPQEFSGQIIGLNTIIRSDRLEKFIRNLTDTLTKQHFIINNRYSYHKFPLTLSFILSVKHAVLKHIDKKRPSNPVVHANNRFRISLYFNIGHPIQMRKINSSVAR